MPRGWPGATPPLLSPTVRRYLIAALALTFLSAACGSAGVPPEGVSELPPTDYAAMSALLAASDRPVVLNVWASWCIPCRSEAPLLRRAHEESGDRVRFVGVAVRDDQEAARGFIAEFGLVNLEHYFDPSGSVPGGLGAAGVPHTFFFAPGGHLVHHHAGVIDEGALALQIDELLGREG
ncbi:MAG: TlpA family protein disulfide reductase [Acidimicrobiia bacterium]|nr:TlpA family protein disulfide reductase [Acidimicrobiia bacterium]